MSTVMNSRTTYLGKYKKRNPNETEDRRRLIPLVSVERLVQAQHHLKELRHQVEVTVSSSLHISKEQSLERIFRHYVRN